MNREDEICLALQGLINGIDFDTGEVIELSDKVKDSLRVIASVHNCKERCQQYSKIAGSQFNQAKDWDIVSGTFKEIINIIKKKRPNHLVIIQNGYFYESLDKDADFFVNKFGYNSYFHNNSRKTGFPVNAKKVFHSLRGLMQPYVIVSQLPRQMGQKVQRAITDVYDGFKRQRKVKKSIKETKNVDKLVASSLIEDKSLIINHDDLESSNLCSDCGCEIPQVRIDSVPGVIRCAKCQSKFEESNPDSLARKIEETFGTREDFKNMSRRQFGINSKTKS